MAITDKAMKLSRLKLRSDQLVEIHLDKIPEPPERMRKLPGVQEWFQQLRLKEERDQQAFHRMLTQINGSIAAAAEPAVVECTTLPGTTGAAGATGATGATGAQGEQGPPGEGDPVLVWMNL